MKNKKNLSAGMIIIISALIWGAIIVWCAYELKGTEYKDKITHIISGGAIMHFITVWAPIGLLAAKQKKEKE